MTEEYLNDDLYAVMKNDEFKTPLMCKYLNIYVGFIDWIPQLTKLWNSAKVNHDSQKMKQVVSAAILLPHNDKSVRIDNAHPENHLLKMPWFQQLNDRDWWELIKKVIDDDGRIDAQRRQAYALGIITPFEYSPMTRQAHNWLFAKAEETGVITSEEIKKDVAERFKNLVAAYGGAVICNIFSRHQESLKHVTNWRTGYFFEKVIYEVYKPEQVYKIKKSELDTTNEKLVKSVRLI